MKANKKATEGTAAVTKKQNLISKLRHHHHHHHHNQVIDDLPNEQDRKATIGCLAAVLNIMFAHQLFIQSPYHHHQQQQQQQQLDWSKTLKKAAPSSRRTNNNSQNISTKSSTKKKNDTIEIEEKQKFCISQEDEDDDDDDSNNNNNKNPSLLLTAGMSSNNDDDDDNDDDGGVSIRRTKEFQKELLLMSTELLFLDPDTHAVEYLPTLNIQCFEYDGNDNEYENRNSNTTSTSTSTSEQLLLDPFLSSFSSAEAGFQCITLLLFRFLLLSNNNVEIDNDNGIDTNNTEQVTKTSSSKWKSKSKSKSKTIIGYDARVRYAFKYLSVSILKYWDLRESQNNNQYLFLSSASATSYATRKFEALEDNISYRLSIISKQIILEAAAAAAAEEEEAKNNKTKDPSAGSTNITNNNTNNPFSPIPSKLKCHSNPMQKKNKSIGRNVSRGLKIGTAAVVGGALIAITGGLAVPAIVGGIAAVAGITASFTAIVGISLLILPATITIFGVGSGILVATKMSKRTKGLTEFDIIHHHHHHHHTNNNTNNDNNNKKKDDTAQQQQQLQLQLQEQEPKLSRTICVNGWLTDEYDFERPFGVTPKLLTNKKELLCRFCSIYAPQVIPKCDTILQEWKGKENELWDILKSAYGKDPDSLLPLDNNEHEHAPTATTNSMMILSIYEKQSIDSMIRNMMGIHVLSLFKEEEEKKKKKNNSNNRPLHPVNLLDDVLSSKNNNNNNKTRSSKKSSSSNRDLKRADDDDDDNDDVVNNKKYCSYMAWDFQSAYSGMELYTISWEKDLLIQLRGSARDVQKDLATKGAELAIKKTIFASLMTAVAIPATLLGLTGMIDEKWTLAAERADEAGILLAESLLKSDAGHRPVNLIGISFGARMIISCLSELARHQKKWEKLQQQQQQQQYQKNENENNNYNSNGSDSRRFSSSSNKRGPSVLLKAGDSIRKSISSSVTSKLGGGSSSSSSTTKKNKNGIYLREPASIIENVVLMGCPSSIKSPTWKTIHGMVAGRLINCYCKNDMMLALMYRLKNPTKLLTSPAGITEIKNNTQGGGGGIINYDVSNLVSSHGEYRLAVKDILDLVGFDQP